MSMKRSLAAAIALTLSSSVMAEDPMKIGFVYVGPIGDHGWSYQHDLGRKAVEAHFGDQVQTTYVENVAEGADAERLAGWVVGLLCRGYAKEAYHVKQV